jgi:hypothetical protein
MPTALCAKCGHGLRKGIHFCPKCGTPIKLQGSQSSQQVEAGATTPPTRTFSNTGRVVIIALLVLLVLIIPVFPRDRVVYVDGVTQTLAQSTSYNTKTQAYANPTPMQMSLYQGSFQHIPDQYYYYYFNNQPYYGCYQPYGSYYPYGCSYPYYYYPFNWYYSNSYNYGFHFANTITIQPSDNVVRVQQSQESNGFSTLVLTHYDGTSFTYRHVFQQNLTQSGSTVAGTSTVTSTSIVTNSVVNPVTTTLQCQRCILQHVTDHVSLLQLIFNF